MLNHGDDAGTCCRSQLDSGQVQRAASTIQWSAAFLASTRSTKTCSANERVIRRLTAAQPLHNNTCRLCCTPASTPFTMQLSGTPSLNHLSPRFGLTTRSQTVSYAQPSRAFAKISARNSRLCSPNTSTVRSALSSLRRSCPVSMAAHHWFVASGSQTAVSKALPTATVWSV